MATRFSAVKSFRGQLALSTALATIAFGYGGRSVYAGSCTGSGGVYSCSGAAGPDVTQTLSGSPLDVDTVAGFGINASGIAFALSGTGGLDFTDNNNAAITGSLQGIAADNTGSGSLTITTNGTVTGTTGRGINAQNNSAGTTNLTVTTGAVSGGTEGIRAVNNGTGNTTVTSNGAVSGSRGIAVTNTAIGTNITITANDNVTGDTQGISVTHNGTGTLSVTASGVVTGGTAEGIRTATGVGKQTYITLNSGAAVSSAVGLAITNDEGNSTTLVNTGAGVTGAINLGDGTDSLTFDGGDFSAVTAFDGGVGTDDSLTFRNVTGSVTGGSVISMENVTVGSGADITASGILETQNLTVDGSLTGNNLAISNSSTGALNVMATGTVTGSTGDGINASNSASGAALTVTAVNVTGSDEGIAVFNSGSGPTSVIATGNVTGTLGNGIETLAVGGDLTITASSNVSGGISGVLARNYGAGDTNITVSGTVSGGSAQGPGKRAGIDTRVGYGTGTTNITLNSGASVSSGGFGTAIYNDNGNSITTVNSGAGFTGDIRLGGGDDDVVLNGTGTSAGAIDGGLGTNRLTFNDATRTVTGAVTGMESVYINGASDVTFEGTVTTGVFASNSDVGALKVTATLEVTGGVDARQTNASNTGDLIVSSGGGGGIFAQNEGTGAVSVTSTGTVTGESFNGIFASNNNNSATGDVTVSAADVEGGTYGILAGNYGAGGVSVTATGLVTGVSRNGISVRNNNNSTTGDITVSAADVEGALDGISAFNYGTGGVSVTTTGLVTGTSYYGIETRNLNNSATGNVTVSASDVVGGIVALNYGTGTTSVTVSGTVNGGNSSAGIVTSGGEASITLNSGAAVSSTGGTAITNNFGNSTVRVNSGASVTGAINLGGGTDSLTFDGGDFTAVTSFDGGAGTGDSLTLRNFSGTVASSDISGMENITIGNNVAATGNFNLGSGDGSLTFDGGDFSGVTSFDGGDGTDSLTFRNVTGTVASGAITGMESVTIGTAANVTFGGTVDASATIDFGAQLSLSGTVTGALNNNGTFTTDGLATVSGQMTNIGDINVATGKALSPDGNLDNFGGVNLTGGSVTGSGTVNNFGAIQGKGAVTAQLANSGQVFANGGGVLSVTNLASGTNSGEMRVQTGSSLNIGAMNNASLVVGAGNVIGAVQNDATIRAEGGTLRLISSGNSNTASGVIEASGGNTVQFSQGLASNGGLIALTGGAFDNNGNVLTNAATGRIQGRGTVRTGGLTNDGQVSFTSGTSDLFGTVQNSVGARVDINDATVNFFDEVTNFGTLESNRSTVSFLGGFVNNGTLITDPNVINFTDFTNNDPAAVIAEAGDEFIVSNDVLGDTSNNTTWDTSGAILRFVAGVDNDHVMQLYGIDLGTDIAGLVDNFAWGTVELTAGQTISLEDIKADGEAGALYLDTILLADFATDIIDGVLDSIIGNGLNVYYNAFASGNLFLAGLTYNLQNGGQLIALSEELLELPEPSSIGMLLLGLFGLGRLRRRKAA
jgi:hypothetical protein